MNLNQTTRWSNLRLIGNSNILKFTILIPIIGYMILFNEHLVQHFNLAEEFFGEVNPENDKRALNVITFWRLYCFYFGFCFLGGGAFLFHLICPPQIRRHGDQSNYVREEKQVTPGKSMKEYFKFLKFPENLDVHIQIKEKVSELLKSVQGITNIKGLYQITSPYIV
jgi:hypothetical protein